MISRWDTEEAMKRIEQFKITEFRGVPTMYIQLLNHPAAPKYDLSSLKTCICGSAPMPVEVARNWREKYGIDIWEGYGLSEATTVNCGNIAGRRPPKYGSIGKCYQKCNTIKIFDEKDCELPSGQAGEIVIKGPGVMKGYWNKPVETAEALRNGWLHTGDIGYADEDGYLYITDRKKDLIIRGGENIYPKEIENVLHMHPQVLEAGVIGIPDPVYGEVVKAFVVLKTAGAATEEHLMNFCKENLPTYKRPKSIQLMDSLPKSAVGKILRRELRKIGMSRKVPAGSGKAVNPFQNSNLKGGFKMKKRLFCVILIGFLMVFTAGAAMAQQPADQKVYKWNFQSHWPAGSTSFKPLKNFFDQNLNKLTNGRLQITLHPAGAMVPSKDIFAVCRKGTIEGATAAPIYWMSIIPISAVAANCPMTFRNAKEGLYFHFNLGFEQMLKDAHAKHNLLYYTEKIYPTAMIGKKPIRKIEDFKGYKIRSSGAIAEMLKDLGAVPSFNSRRGTLSGPANRRHRWGALGSGRRSAEHETRRGGQVLHPARPGHGRHRCDHHQQGCL